MLVPSERCFCVWLAFDLFGAGRRFLCSKVQNKQPCTQIFKRQFGPPKLEKAIFERTLFPKKMIKNE
eukprot:3950327-Amphidinium_carterae.1